MDGQHRAADEQPEVSNAPIGNDSANEVAAPKSDDTAPPASDPAAATDDGSHTHSA